MEVGYKQCIPCCCSNPSLKTRRKNDQRNITKSLLKLSGRPAQVGLAHELGHAKDGIEGKATREKSIVRDPDDNARVYMTKDEIKVRKNIDNPVRAEQGVKPRALPIIIP